MYRFIFSLDLTYIRVVFWIVIVACGKRNCSFAQDLQSISDRIQLVRNNDFNATQDKITSEPEEGTEPSEVQKAVCTVMAGEVKASAEALTTKTLKGVCGTAEMNLAFRNLEKKLYTELNEIKLFLRQLTHMQGIKMVDTNKKLQNLPDIFVPLVSPLETTNTTPPPTTTTAKPPSVLKLQNTVKTDKPKELKKTPILKNLENEKQVERDVLKFNNTMLADKNFKLFSYYWKIENFTAHIKSGQTEIMESPVFSIKGKTLQLKATFNHLHRDYLYLQLNYAQLKTSNRNNIALDMGSLFKQIKQTEQILFKHKISILDQNNQHAQNLVSQEFNNFDMGFSIPNSALLSSYFIKNDSLLIQLIFYL